MSTMDDLFDIPFWKTSHDGDSFDPGLSIGSARPIDITPGTLALGNKGSSGIPRKSINAGSLGSQSQRAIPQARLRAVRAPSQTRRKVGSPAAG